MSISQSIFQRNDIRGIVGKNLYYEDIYCIGLCLPSLLKASVIVVGRDMRVSSEDMFTALTTGICATGCKVIDIGMQETPAFYYAVEHYAADGGVMITASHNPPEYNGLKIVKSGALPMDSENGLQELEKCCVEYRGDLDRNGPSENKKRVDAGSIEKKDPLNEYIRYLHSFMNSFGKKRIVIDCSHGMAGKVAKKIFNKTKVETILLHQYPDGTFPVHGPNPMKTKNLVILKKNVQKENADIGICFDGDADRVVFIDADGNSVSPDIITALVSGYLLRQCEQKKEQVLYDLRSSMCVPEFIEKSGGTPIMCPIGHSRIKKMMREKKALIGGELTGHYYFRDNNYCDSAWITIIYMLALIEEEDKPLRDLVSEVGGYYFSGEINYEVENKTGILTLLNEIYQDGNISTLDGLRIEYPDWWFIVRESTTEPFLRLVIEAKKSDELEKHKREIEMHISSTAGKGMVP